MLTIANAIPAEQIRLVVFDLDGTLIDSRRDLGDGGECDAGDNGASMGSTVLIEAKCRSFDCVRCPPQQAKTRMPGTRFADFLRMTLVVG